MTSEETRRKLSEKQKAAHAEGRHPGWAHKNQDLTRSSYPERWFRKVLSEDQRFKGVLVIEQQRCGKYFLDFAFAEFMVDLEIDGCQHRRDGQTQKDAIRDKFLNTKGWSVYRIEWQRLYKDTQQCLDDFQKFLLSKDRDLNVFVEAVRKPVHLPVEQKRQNIAEQRMKKLVQANIDFSKFGWVQQAADLLGMKPQKIHGWMKRYFPDTLEKCFTRTSPT
jgi:very-short-patch-repair endonuclease